MTNVQFVVIQVYAKLVLKIKSLGVVSSWLVII